MTTQCEQPLDSSTVLKAVIGMVIRTASALTGLLSRLLTP